MLPCSLNISFTILDPCAPVACSVFLLTVIGSCFLKIVRVFLLRNSKVSKLKKEHFLKYMLGVLGPTEVATVKMRNFRCEDGTIFRIFTVLALKTLFLLVAPSGGLKHPNMQTKKVSKFNLESFGIFTKKICLGFSVVKWVKQWRHEQN